MGEGVNIPLSQWERELTHPSPIGRGAGVRGN